MKLQKFQKSEAGIAHLAFILVLLVAAVIGSAAYVVYTKQAGSTQSTEEQVVSQSQSEDVVPVADDATVTSLEAIDPVKLNQADSTELDKLAEDL